MIYAQVLQHRFKTKSQPRILKGWKQMAEFLGEPVSVIKHGHRNAGLRAGRFVTSSPEQLLNTWIGQGA